MTRRLGGLLVLAGAALVAPASAAPTREECARMALSRDARVASAGHECLAALELTAPGDRAAAADRALRELDLATAAAPGRKESHLARLQVLLDAERWDEVPDALARGLASAAGTTAADWTAVPAELFLHGLAEESLAAARQLEDRWPRDPEVLAAVGAALAVLERDEEALIYLRAAAERAPGEPLGRWNLARLLAYMGRTEEAAAEFSAWSAVETDPERLARNSCLFAGFVETQLGDRPRACALQQQFCPEGRRPACAPLPAPPKESQP